MANKKKAVLERLSVDSGIAKNLRMLSIVTQGRKFQIWRYYISHHTLLIRSPKIEAAKENIDIVISGVSYISARTTYEHFAFELGVEADRSLMVTRLGRPLTSKECVFCMIGDNWRDHIVALGAFPSVNSGDFLATPDLPLFELHESPS